MDMNSSHSKTSTSTTASVIVVRDAQLNDLASITELYTQEIRDGVATFEYDVVSIDEMKRRFESIRALGLPYFVAEIDGKFAGYSYASKFRDRAGYRWTLEDTVYVDPQFQGRGVGRALLSRLLDDCTTLGYRQMMAVIGDTSNRASIVLHERLGFEIVGILKGTGWKHQRWLDVVQMQRSLGDGTKTTPDGEQWQHTNNNNNNNSGDGVGNKQ
jgi:phosphinothricin acetyltransferase